MTLPAPPLSVRLSKAFACLRGARRGNVAIITALMMVPMISALGFGVDYALQKQRQDRLAGVADATALYPLSPSLMSLSASAAQTLAQQFWSSQASAVTGTGGMTSSVAITDTPAGNTILRQVKVSFSGTSTTYMLGMVGLQTLPLAGSSSSTSSLAPRINFYMLVDTSPSMAIAATTAGINTMVQATINAPYGSGNYGGCAFACHESNPAADSLNNPGGEDNFALARNLNVTLRIDLVNQAVANMLTTAANTATKNNTVYGMSVSTMDYQVGQLYQTNNISTNLATAQTKVGTLAQLEVAYNGCVTSSNCNLNNAGNDQDSGLDASIATVGTLNTASYSSANTPGYQMYSPGLGTTNTGDSPQEVLFIISDGVVDTYSGGNRVMAPINTQVDNCTAIKKKGIRIAFLYLTYNPLPTNQYYTQHIGPFQPQIATAAEACASPGLYTQVNTGGDISGALSNLFQVAVTTARLTQ